MKHLVPVLLVLSACFGLDKSAFPVCETETDCAETHVCVESICVLPDPDDIACGNGRVEQGEVCDDGLHLRGACEPDCSQTCGEAVFFDGSGKVFVADRFAQGAFHGLVVGTPTTKQVWFYPEFPAQGPVAWTLLVKKAGASGNRLQIDLDRQDGAGAVRASLRIDNRLAASVDLPGAAWYHLSFEMDRSGADVVVTPYLNGQQGTVGRVTTELSETQDGVMVLGAADTRANGADRAFVGFVAGLSLTNRVVHGRDFVPIYPFVWHGHPWLGEDDYSQAFYRLDEALGITHGPSNNRVYWGSTSQFNPLWIDDGYELGFADPNCLPGGRCGDGQKSIFEACDDGNTEGGDECKANCRP